MKSLYRTLPLSIVILFASISIASAATSTFPVRLNVQGCNNNGICEAVLGEDTSSCPADCHTGPPGDDGGGGGGSPNYFYDIRVTPTQTGAYFDWKSRFPALSTLKWGLTTDYALGSTQETMYSATHTSFIQNLLTNTRYYFKIEGQNTDRTTVPAYVSFFNTLRVPDDTRPSPPTDFIATPNIATNTITLTWHNPTDSNFNYVRIVRNRETGNTSPFLGQIIYEGNLEYAIDRDIFVFTRYFYTIFARTTEGEFSSGVEANAMVSPISIDQCILNPSSCVPPPNPCTLNPSSCINPPDPCLSNPSLCTTPPTDPCLAAPSPCTTEPIDLPVKEVPNIVTLTPSIAVGLSVLLSTLSALLSGSFAFGEIGFLLLRLWSLLLIAFGLKKRTPPWGVVYDSVTKQPLDPAYVVLLDKNGNEVASCITDLDGRYGFVAEPGVYTIVATKTNYSFPSRKLHGMRGDELYGNLYFGHDIEITKSGSIIASNIPLDPINFDWNEFAKRDQHLMKFFNARDVWLGRLSNVLFWAGSLFSVYAVIVSPTGYNIAIVGLSLFVYILRTLGLQSYPKGSIFEGLTKNPLPFSILRVYGEGSTNELYHKVADRTGRYYAIVPNGKYRAIIEKKNADESYTKIPVSEPVSVTRGYLKKNFKI